MQEYEFTLKFKFSQEKNPESYIESLAEAGCEDALIGIAQMGRIALNFIRESESAFDAVYSAIEQVKQVIPDATLIEATPDFVGVSDIAEITGYSRQNIRQLILNNITSFPSPIHDDKSALWHLSSVLDWFKNKGYDIDNSLRELADITVQLNLAKEVFNLSLSINEKFKSILT